ncbi:TetR/AcrR family transcriptional regulator [Microbacterium sp. NPDC058345]|uniref:TetR/AcrR family transcriptional regulator n=1 Tax=Microbacterium sp. NPDC058345 TaxID=3346455 RepID=UPI00365F31E1
MVATERPAGEHRQSTNPGVPQLPARRTPDETEALRTTLLDSAASLVKREGARSLTMRALALEAKCAVGLPYKIFDSRDALLAQLVTRELAALSNQLRAWSRKAGTRTVGENLDEFATLLLESDTPALVHANADGDEGFLRLVDELSRATGLTDTFQTVLADYLAKEQRQRRIGPDVDVDAVAFFVLGAVHNLTTAGSAFPVPSRATLTRYLRSIAELSAG